MLSPYVEQLFQCALKVLKEDLAQNPDKPGLIREVFISNQRLAQMFGPDYRKEALAEILKQLMTWRSVSSQCRRICYSYKQLKIFSAHRLRNCSAISTKRYLPRNMWI